MTTHKPPSGNNEVPYFDGEYLPVDQIIAQAVEAVAKGENVEQILEIMLISLPAAEREKAKKKFAAALAKKGLRQPSGELADIPSRATLARIRNALAVSTRAMVERVMQLVRARPDIAAAIKQAGDALAKNGVVADKVTVTETDLGTMAPLATAKAAQQDRGTGRS